MNGVDEAFHSEIVDVVVHGVLSARDRSRLKAWDMSLRQFEDTKKLACFVPHQWYPVDLNPSAMTAHSDMRFLDLGWLNALARYLTLCHLFATCTSTSFSQASVRSGSSTNGGIVKVAALVMISG